MFRKLTLFLAFLFCTQLWAQWTSTNGPEGASVRDLVYNKEVIMAYGSNDGIYVSSDSGYNWSSSNFDFEGDYIYHIYLDDSIAMAGAWLSYDHGANWSRISNDSIEMRVGTRLGSDLYIADSDMLYRSEDNGKSWTLVEDINSRIDAITVKEDTLFIGTNDYYEPLWFYVKGDDSCTLIPSAIGMSDIKDMAVQKGRLLVLTSKALYGAPLTSEGSWENMGKGVLASSSLNALSVNDSIIAVGSFDRKVYFYHTSDTGSQWNYVHALPHNMVNSLLLYGDDMFVGNNWTLLRSSDMGLSWQVSATGLHNAISEVLYAYNDILFTGHDEIWRKVKSEEKWEQVHNGFDANIATFFSIDTLLFVGTNGKGVHCSSDSGVTWEKRSTGLSSMHVATMTAIGERLFVSTWEGVSYSDDYGITWTDSKSGYANELLAVDTVLFCSIEQKIYRSSDRGESWEYTNLSGSNYTMTSLDSFCYVSIFDKEIYRTTDLGETWETCSKGIYDLTVWEMKAYGGVLYAGTNSGTFVSENQGTNWMPYNLGLANSRVCEFARIDDILYAVSRNRGIWKRGLFDTTMTLYTINIISSDSGTVSPGDSLIIPTGEQVEISISPKEHYSIDSLILDDATIEPTNKVVLRDIQKDHSLRVAYAHTMYSVTIPDVAHGTLDPSGEVPVKSGESFNLAVTPDAHYKTTSIIAGGKSLFIKDTVLVYNVERDMSVNVTFAPLDTFTIYTYVTGNGTVSPSLETRVEEFDSKTLFFVPDAEYEVTEVLLNNVLQSLADSLVFDSLRRDHEVYVTFELQTPVLKDIVAGAQQSILTENPLPNNAREITLQTTNPGMLYIYDPVGNEVGSYRLNQKGANQITLEKHLHSGLYLLLYEMQSDGKTVYAKQVVTVKQ